MKYLILIMLNVLLNVKKAFIFIIFFLKMQYFPVTIDIWLVEQYVLIHSKWENT